MRPWARQRALLCLLLLPCLGFEWPGRVYRLTHALAHAEPAQRRELVRELGQYSAESVKEPLLLALEDSDIAVRLEAAEIAGHVRLRDAVPILLDWLDDKEADTRRRAAVALGSIGEARALQSLVRALGDSSSDVRRAAVVALGRLSQPDAIVPLLGRLDDSDLSVRIEALAALGAARDAQAVVPVLGAAADAAAEVRVAAFTALGRIADARALPALTRGLSDDVEDARLSAAAALGRLHDKDAVRAMKQALERADPRLGQALIAALAGIDDDGARALLITQLEVPALRQAAMRSLVQQARGSAHVVGPSQAPPPPARAAQAARTLTLVTNLAALLSAPSVDTRVAAAEALARVGEVAPIDAALPSLIAVLPAAEGALSDTLLDALARSAAPDALMPLLERLGQSSDQAIGPVLTALTTYFERAEPDGRAADPLLGRLTQTSQIAASQRAQIVRLLGRVAAPRALPVLLPLLDDKDSELRIATVQALAAIGAAESGSALFPLLEAQDAPTRFEAARALRTTANAEVAAKLLATLTAERAADRHALLIALGGTLSRLGQQHALPATLAHGALRALAALIAGDDDELADAALDALAVWAPPHALEEISSGLRLPSSRRRSAAVYALGVLADPNARQVVRYVMQHGSAREASAATAAMGEIGDQRDVAWLLKVTKRQHWPVPGAAAYALQRMAERGALRPHLAARELCALGRSREPYVRANVAAALASLGAGPCDDGGPSPLDWLSSTHAAIVRAAAARWLRTAAAAGKLDLARANDALDQCAASDIEPYVRAACTGTAALEPLEATDVYAYSSDDSERQRGALVALRLSSFAVFLGYTDANGHLRLRAAPRGELRLEDPAIVPLEPPP